MSIMAARSDRTMRTTCEVTAQQFAALTGPQAETCGQSRARLLVLVDDLLESVERPSNARGQSLASLFSHRSAGRAHLADQAAGFHGTGEEALGRLLDNRVADLEAALSGKLPVGVTNQFGNSHLVDYLRATLLEAVVLAHSCGIAPQPAALRMCARTLSQALGERYPGQTIEVRIPPASAVQVSAFGEGPTHTRGTPPNVVETDEQTWLLLGTGLLSLDQALDQARATASGSHHQALSRMLPVIDLTPLV